MTKRKIKLRHENVRPTPLGRERMVESTVKMTPAGSDVGAESVQSNRDRL